MVIGYARVSMDDPGHCATSLEVFQFPTSMKAVGAPRLVSSETNPPRPEWTEHAVVPQSTFHTSVIRF